VNKTPLSRLSNISMGGDAPSVYLKRIEERQKLSSSALDDILRTHLIEPAHLRADDFDAFMATRSQALAALVGTAMGKPVVEKSGGDEIEADGVELDEVDDDALVGAG
jgi:hypothetical protein